MTRYLSAVGLETPPFMELFENYAPPQSPIQLGFDPPLVGQVSRARFSEDLTVMATATTARREDIEGLGNPDFTYAGEPIFSADSKTLLYTGSASIPPKLLVKAGQYYVEQPAFNVGATYALYGAISSDGRFVAVVLNNDSSNIRIYEKGSPSYNLVATLPRNTAMSRMSFTAEDAFLVSAGGISGTGWTRSFIHRTGSTFSQVTFGDEGVVTATELLDADYREDGKLAVCFYRTSGTELPQHRFIYRTYNVDGTIAESNEIYIVSSSLGSNIGINARAMDRGKGFCCIARFVQGGNTRLNMLIVANSVAAPNTYTQKGSTYVSPTDAASTTGVPWLSVGEKFIATIHHRNTTGTRTIIHEITSPWPDYAVTLRYQGGGTFTGAIRSSMNERLGVVSYRGNAGQTNLHVSLTTFAAITSTFPGTTFTPASVASVTYSPDGSIMLSTVSSLPFAGILDGGGEILDYATLEGTFVTLYDRVPSTGTGAFEERNFVQHIVGTVITDMVISPANKSFLYHANHPTSTEAGGRGRFVYWIENAEDNDQMEQLGFIFESGDEKSLAAVSPSESHFAVVTQSSSQQTFVRLYRFEGSGYIEADEKPTLYGPPAFSHCDSVVIAHGGDQPYSFFEHKMDMAGDRLVYVPVVMDNWDSSTIVLDIAFSLDCSTIIIVTEEEIIVIADQPPNDEGVKEPIEEDREDRPADENDSREDDPPIRIDPDNPDTIIITPPGDTPGGGGWTVGPDGVINSLKTYKPYVCVTVTLRNR